MVIKTITNGKLGTNSYLIYCYETNKAAIIDPAEGYNEIIGIAKELELNLIMIINTHGHCDHISGNKKIYNEFNCDIAIGIDDASMLHDTSDNFAKYLGMDNNQPSASILLKDKDEINIGNIKLQVIKTPGHTSGGISLYCEESGVLFSGDTLFRRSIGRVDLPGGSLEEILKSLKKLISLPEDTTVYPGHSRPTTIAFEKESNPYCRMNGDN